MTQDAASERVRTRPSPRIGMLALLSLLVYAAGANIGAGTVLFLAAGMAVGTGWSVTGFLRRAGDLRVRSERTVVMAEGRGDVVAMVSVPRGVIGVIGTAPMLPPETTQDLLDTLGQAVVGEPPAGRHWATLPRSGTTAQVRCTTVLGRGEAQQLRFELELSDVFGLVRRRLTLTAPLAHVVPAHGAAAAFRAATIEGAEDDRVAHALTANGPPATELRPWRPGEAIRAVHWPASERAAELLVRPRAPETTQRRTLAVEDRVWTRDALDIRCRDLAATAEGLTRAGVEVEVTAAGQLVPWGAEARMLLASLPPNASTDHATSPEHG